MKRKKEVGVIGLGKFGFSLAESLTSMGHKVIGLDSEEGRVRNAQEILAKVYVGDATDKAVLEQLRFQDLDCVAVSVGKSMETSILTALNLLELKIPQIIVKSLGVEHGKILSRLGISWIVQPEVDIARQVAHQLVNPGVLDLLPLAGGMLVQEVIVDKWQGKSLADLALPKKGIMVVAKMPAGENTVFKFVPDAQERLQKGDRLIIIGNTDNVLALEA